MAYVLIKDGVVVQKQPNAQDGFISAPESVVCGYLHDGHSFSAPPVQEKPTPEPSDLEIIVAALKEKVGIKDEDIEAAKASLMSE